MRVPLLVKITEEALKAKNSKTKMVTMKRHKNRRRQQTNLDLTPWIKDINNRKDKSKLNKIQTFRIKTRINKIAIKNIMIKKQTQSN